MTLSKVVRKGSYQGVAQWGISTSSEITPSRKTARKWAELENARTQTPKPTLTELETELARGLYRRMPVESCHSGRGWGHSESCFRSCHSTWSGDVNEMAHVLHLNREGFDREAFIALANRKS